MPGIIHDINFSNISILIAVLLLIWYRPITTYVHEVGHNVMIYITAKLCKYDLAISTKIICNYFKGKTLSNFYWYLYKNRNNAKYRKYIKLNSLAGVITEFIVVHPIVLVSQIELTRHIHISDYVLQDYCVINSIFFIISIVMFTLNFSSICHSNDIRYLNNPELFIPAPWSYKL